MRNVPMFDKPAEQPVELSEKLSAFEYRLNRGEKVKWTAIKVKGYRPCQECAYMQHQTGGQFGPRRQAKHRRTHPMSPALELCTAHKDLWLDRDEADSGIPRAA
jgi:hypothetical protein